MEVDKMIDIITINKSVCDENTCRTKLKIFDMECRCKQKFCSVHRLPESHACSYDFKKDKIKLEKVVSDKVIKI
jgi:predicted nucleic acid binding AN1-type Zn finger protein